MMNTLFFLINKKTYGCAHTLNVCVTFRAVALPWLCGWRRGVDISREFLTDVSCSSPTAVGVVPSTLKKTKLSTGESVHNKQIGLYGLSCQII